MSELNDIIQKELAQGGQLFECDCCSEELPMKYWANDDDQCVWCLAAILSFKEAV